MRTAGYATLRRNCRRHLRFITALLSLVVAVTVSGCGAGNPDSRTVTVGHSLGRTTIDGVPKRIVTLGTQWLDATESLGVQPVGYLDDVLVRTGQSAPWEPTSLHSSTAIDAKGDVPAQVAALHPDLILASTVTDKPTIDKLDTIAPTIPNLSRSRVQSWSDEVRVLGKVLARDDTAQSVIDKVNGQMDATIAKYPGLKGKTFATVYYSGDDQITVFADKDDPTSTFFIRMGMVLAPNLVAMVGPVGHMLLPPGRVSELNADMLGVALAEPDQQGEFQSLPGYWQLPAAQHGTVGFLGLATAIGLDQQSPLSLPYILDRIQPVLAATAR
ncbi:ABC transporter substrate-binding protein [Skermania sp. ID1734]|uniref:ABC transporter substrate-binding protein n=1 Tax=Skermania sp. ID1734 TaxID=2597516 RepID=UPI00163DE2BD|nr:ABC transporter substrate-binding protein [Skermania sp. ID1734]